MNLQIALADRRFADWPALLELLHTAFSYMDRRIAPRSSLHLLTPSSIARKAQNESLFLATDSGELVGCVFAELQRDSVYIGKLAVHPDYQRMGIGRSLVDAVEHYAVSRGFEIVELNTRIELTETHRAFQSLGYVVSGEHSHEGYARPTFISMRKVLGKQRR